MFTGIVAAVGRIQSVVPLGGAQAGVRLTIDAGVLGLDDVALGDSIAIQGACMTVIAKHGNAFDVEVSRESLRLTAGLHEPGEVNLEKALRANDRLGGHLVSGHVDGLGEVIRFAPAGESHELVIRAPRELAKYLAYKGSITVNGVSLTVNRVRDMADDAAGNVDGNSALTSAGIPAGISTRGTEISINLIPHTIAVTTLRHLAPGRKVNLEIDLIARYVERMMSAK
jgi:riboflavin synthase